MGLEDVVVGQTGRALHAGAIGVYPRMKLHSAAVTLLYHPCHWVPVGRWCLALHSGEVTAPRLNLTLVEGVTFAAHLEDDGVGAILFQLVELMGEHLLYFCCRFTQIHAVDKLHPSASDLTFAPVGIHAGRSEQP